MATGVLENWCVWTMPATTNERAEYERMRPGEWCAVITGQVVEDTQMRWPVGSAMRSTALIGFDLQNMKACTQNSLYELRGPGLIKSGIPSDYAAAVGETIEALAHLPRNQGPDKRCLSDVDSVSTIARAISLD